MRRGIGRLPAGRFGLGAALLALTVGARVPAAVSGADFLRFIPSARTLGMGETMAAAGSGPGALSGNPAGLVGVPGSIAGLTHGTELAGQRQEAVAFVTGGHRTAAGAQIVLSTMSFDAEDGTGGPVSVEAQDLVASAGVARKFGTLFRAGVTGRIWTTALLDRRATGFSGDLGLRMVRAARWSAGIVVQQLGGRESLGAGSAALPGAVRAGLAARHPFGAVTTAATVEWVAPLGGGEAGAPHAGMEVSWQRLALRAGYAGGADARWTAGGSAGTGPFSLHYALGTRGIFGSAHRISAEWQWGGGMI